MFRFSAFFFFRPHGFHYSTLRTTSVAQKSHLFIIDSLRFSEQDAISVSSRGNLSHLKSTSNFDSLLHNFKNYGLDLVQIREIVSSVPQILTCKADTTVEPKIRVFKELGLSGSDLVNLIKRNPNMLRTQPCCLNKSEGKIRQSLEFYMHDLGYTPSYLISHSNYFTLSLNKRVIPRYKMLEILKEKKLVKDKPTLASIVSYSELKFLAFLKGFEKGVPGLCEIYMDSVRRVS